MWSKRCLLDQLLGLLTRLVGEFLQLVRIFLETLGSDLDTSQFGLTVAFQLLLRLLHGFEAIVQRIRIEFSCLGNLLFDFRCFFSKLIDRVGCAIEVSC